MTDAIEKLIEAAEVVLPIIDRNTDEVNALRDAIAPARAELERMREEVERAKQEVEICHARETCCCGDYMKGHSAYSGHSPVSMYDWSLHKVEEERDRLRAEIRAAEREACLRDIDAVAFEAKAAFGELWALDRIRARIRARADKEGER